MTCPRRVVPGTTYLLTRRCTQRRFTLVPRGLVPALFGYCIALAAKRHGILVHACGQYSPETMRAELFGHTKGALTGATRP